VKLSWATDIHLNFLADMARRRFLESVGEQADALVVTGDIAESHILGTSLTSLAELTGQPPRQSTKFSKLNRPHGIPQLFAIRGAIRRPAR
jgi:UDP-2,3-diacylglucosamine pyrophosphatase LpxH